MNDRGAQYPITIDPLIWAQQNKLLASDGKNSARAVVASTGFVFSPGAHHGLA